MKILMLTVLNLIISICVNAQKSNKYIDINPFFRKDWHPEFSYIFDSRASTDNVKTEGKSWGINVNYKVSINKHSLIKAGVGYYRYAFDKIIRNNTVFGKSNSRHINFPSTLYILFYTDKYHYHTSSINIGAERLFDLKKDIQLSTGFDLYNFFTFSQSYHITYENPDNPIENPYILKQRHYLGLSSTFHAGLLKRTGKLNYGPTIIIPIYDVWKQDDIFPEENKANARSKWFRGIGFGINFNYLLSK